MQLLPQNSASSTEFPALLGKPTEQQSPNRQRQHIVFVAAQNSYKDQMNEWISQALSPNSSLVAPGTSSFSVPASALPLSLPAADIVLDFESQHQAIVSEQLNQLEASLHPYFERWAKLRLEVSRQRLNHSLEQNLHVFAQAQHHKQVQDIFNEVAQSIAQKFPREPAMSDAATQLEASFALAVAQGLFPASQAKSRYTQALSQLWEQCEQEEALTKGQTKGQS